MKTVFGLILLSLIITSAFAVTASSNSASAKRSFRDCKR
jgi:hypothetical protein